MNENKRSAEESPADKSTKKHKKKKSDDNNNINLDDSETASFKNNNPFDKLSDLPRRGTKLFGVVDTQEEKEKLQQARGI